MVSIDRKIFDENSEVRQRMFKYGGLVEKLHILVLRWPFKILKIGKKINGFDLVTSQDPFETGLFAWLASKILRARLQLQIHTDFMNPYFRQESLINRIRVMIAKFLIPRADLIRVVSNRIKKSLSAISSKPLTVEISPISVDTEKIKNAPIKIDLHKKYPQFDFIILMASRLTREKNIGLAIRVMADIVKQFPKTGLIIVGSGPEEKNLKIGGNVILESWQDDLASYYKTADLFLLTSNYEGYGRSIIEAVSAGCNIISTDVGITDEILPRENIFAPNDQMDLTEKIIKVIKKYEIATYNAKG